MANRFHGKLVKGSQNRERWMLIGCCEFLTILIALWHTKYIFQQLSANTRKGKTRPRNQAKMICCVFFRYFSCYKLKYMFSGFLFFLLCSLPTHLYCTTTHGNALHCVVLHEIVHARFPVHLGALNSPFEWTCFINKIHINTWHIMCINTPQQHDSSLTNLIFQAKNDR